MTAENRNIASLTPICLSILLFVMWLAVGCSDIQTNALSKEEEIIVSPTPTPEDFPQDSDFKVIKVEGCEIPSPSQKRQTDKKTSYQDSDAGKRVKVTSTVYESTNDFFFTRGALYNPIQRIEVPAKLNKLVWIEELKVKDKIFGYNIFSQGATLGESTGKPVLDEHKNILTCYDFDGDGRFEYLINIGDKAPLVPKWVVQ
jgi:hypothetical protein